MEPKPFPLEPFTAGDTWQGLPTQDGVPFFSLQIDGGAPASLLAKVVMRFTPQDQTKKATVVEISSDSDAIEIITPAAWTFSIPAQAIPELIAGTWDWQIKTIDAAACKETWLADSIVILRNI